MKGSEFSRKLINYMYMSMCKTMKQLPFSGSHWLEQFMIGAAQYALDEYAGETQFIPKEPVEACCFFLNLLDREGFLNAGDYRLEESGDNILVYVSRNNCVYREYCLRAPVEDLPFYCARLGTFQAVLQRMFGKSYSASVNVDVKGVCHGRLFPATQPKEEIVTREGHILKIAGRRAILLPQEIYASLLLSVKEHAPHALKYVLYDAGYRSGISLARKTRDLYPDTQDCLQFLLELIKNDGLGNAELVSFEPSNARTRIRCYDSFQVSVADEYGQLYRTPQVICDLLRGIFAAFLSVLCNKKVICEEMSCQSMGGSYCEFLAMPLPEKFEEGGDKWPKE